MPWSSSTGWNNDGWNTVVSVASFTGPGDIVSGWLSWWGFQGYNGAYSNHKAVRIVRAIDSAQQDFNILSTGVVDAAGIATFLTGTTGKVVTFYDQTGNGLDLTQSTDANRPVLTQSSLNSLPGATFASATPTILTSSTTWATAGAGSVYTAAIVANRTPSVATYMSVFGSSSNNQFIGFTNQTNSCGLFDGNNVTAATESDTNPHVMIDVNLNTTSSTMTVDGGTPSSSGSGGSGFTWTGTPVMGASDTGGTTFPYTGIFYAGGFVNGDQSSHVNALTANMRAPWGF